MISAVLDKVDKIVELGLYCSLISPLILIDCRDSELSTVSAKPDSPTVRHGKSNFLREMSLI